MDEIKFDNGVKTFKVNGDAEIRFNPTDSAFAERLTASFTKLQEQQDQFRAEAEKVANEDAKSIYDFCKKKDAEMRGLIDSCFDEPVCQKVFGNLNVYAFAGGLPIWANFVLAIFDVIEKECNEEQSMTSDAVKKYVEKYRRKR